MAWLLGALAAVSALAQEPKRIDYSPVLMFNQRLYFGSLKKPKALAFDKKNAELWVADAGDAMISIFTPIGTDLYSFGSRELIKNPTRIALTSNGGVIVLDADNAKLRLFNYRGVFVKDLVFPALGEKPVIGAVRCDEDGNLYIAENRTGQIFVFRLDGTLKFQFGSHGFEDGQFQSVCGIAIDSNGDIYVADQRGVAVQRFDHEGNFVKGWGAHEMGSMNFSLPSGIAVDSKHRVIVSDELRHQVKVFDPEGHLLAIFGGLGDGRGQLSFPTDVCVDDRDRVYVSERNTDRVQIFETK